MSLPITPETRVGALLEAYPGVEDALIACAPAFAKLRNPILRKTVARVATLEQAARIGGIDVRELVRKLREATGQQVEPAAQASTMSVSAGEKPAWVKMEKVRRRIDADILLERGEHPFGSVRQSIATLQGDELLCLTSSFYPAPLVDALADNGFKIYSIETEPGRYETFVGARDCSPA